MPPAELCCAAAVHEGGLQVRTTLDYGLQRMAESTVGRRIADLSQADAGEPATNVSNGALVAIEPGTGDIVAMVGLAGLHASGFGVRQNYARAIQWYEKAARRGHASAQLNLGDAYARGRGVKRDPIAAHMWLSLAAGQGKSWAAQRRDQIEKSMTPTQIASAQARASAFRIAK